jgi:hypothetical protein
MSKTDSEAAISYSGKIDPPHRRVTVPDHKEIAKGTLRTIIREIGLTIDELKDLL